MIADSLENAACYFNINPRITSALKFLQNPSSMTLSLGRHAVEGDAVFALVQEYQTKRPDETFWETHRKYIDVQYIQSGAEAMGWSPIQQMRMKQNYDPAKDIVVWDGEGQILWMPAGNFVIFMPHDAHMGGLVIGQPQLVRKIVMKVAVD
ncbi:MAG TPA: YhcH/YjgK/YiaL family protein [Tepidisphaeraceae bacterium]|nr:YhcH/YjgK/YiaL family protein [Tepidisphaeraceae bacterium]